ncbi:MAG TPA: M13-type metalloendopeptidase [Pseudomonadales bacterium]|nr:M13-type metalloendopeptidase [Pseudomonadales bacterium]
MNKTTSFLIIVALALMVGFYRVSNTSTPVPQTESVSLRSGIYTDNIDDSVRAQDDFYRYTNGKWLATTEIPADKSNYGIFTVLADKAREDVQKIIENAGTSDKPEAKKLADLYASVMDTATIETLGISVLDGLLADIEAIADADTLASYFGGALRNGVSGPFSFYINNDSKQPDRYVPYFYQAGIGLPDRDYYFRDDEKSVQTRQAYLEHIAKMYDLAGWDNGNAAAQTIMTLETAIAEGHWTRVERRDRDKTYNLHTPTSLATLAPGVNWMAALTAAGMVDQAEFVVRNPSYFTHLGELMGKFNLADWKTYARWQVLNTYANVLPEAIDAQNFAFYGTVLKGTEAQEDRWKRAVSTVNGILGEQVGQIYVAEHFPPAAKARMNELVENLREAYRQSILDLAWMGDETKQKAIEKLQKFRPKIGYPDKWKDYSGLEIAADDLFGNTLRANRFEYDEQMAKLGSPVNRDEWFMTPQTVNAYYNPSMNEIVFPAAILQPPFFDLKADDAVNYGGIGGVIGHEMGHGFDDQGAKSDGDGVLQNWWTEQDLAEFKARTQQLVQQYNEFTVLDGEHVNGELTLGENIGDLGGLSIAYKAYQLSLGDQAAAEMDGFSGDQRFFLGWAQVWARKYRDEELLQRLITDPHSPSIFRTNGVVRNMPEFYQAFDVKEGDQLYLPAEQRVKIW